MKMMVLGCGLVGSAMVKDLVDHGFEVTVADISAASRTRLAGYEKVPFIQADLSDAQVLQKLIEAHDLVIGATPGFMGYRTLQTIIECGKDCVDISFFPENSLNLDDLAKKHRVMAIVDCGVAPGFSHMAFGYLSRYFDETERLTCYVGGLPQVRTKPFEYKIVFSALDVIEEYCRPARIVENGQIVVKEALSEIEEIEFDGVGTLEAFNSDGLRTLTETLKVPHMIEKTLRYPGHAEKMKLLRHVGLFDQQPVTLGDCQIRPIDLTAKLLFPKLTMHPGETDLTILKVIGEGLKDGQKKTVTYDLLDYFDTGKNITSMARTTGYTGTVVAELISRGAYRQEGVIPPEYLGMVDGFIEQVMVGLQERGVNITRR